MYPRDDTGDVRFTPLPGEGRWPAAADWTWDHWNHWLTQQGWTVPQRAWYSWARDAYGLGVTIAGEQRWAYRPLPKQIALHSHPASNLLYGGAVGGTKSHGLRWDFYLRGLAVGGYRGLMVRRTMPELRDNHIEKVPGDMALLGCAGLTVDSEGYLRLPVLRTGSKASVLRFGHCASVGDEQRYLGPEYDWLGPDEGVTFQPKQITALMARLRSTIPGVRPVMRVGTNPGGIEPHWWVEHFIEHSVDRTVEKRYRPERYGYILAQLYDNPYLLEPDGTYTEYIAQLDVQDPIRLQQLLEGDWSAHVGQYFKEFRPARHLLPSVEIPASVERIAGLDWGYLRPGVWLLLALLPDGRILVEEELVFRETLAEDAARQIKQQRGRRHVRYTAADPAMWIRDGQTGQSIAETFARAGVPLIKANHERVNGWQRLRAWLKDAPDHRPWLQLTDRCPYLLRTLPALIQDLHRPEDVDTDGDDHAADALRYALMSRPSPSKTSTHKPPPPPNTAGALLAEARTPQHRAIV